MMREPRARWPTHVDVTPSAPPPLGDAAAVITFIGHASFLIQTPHGNLLIDPVYSQHAGPFGVLGPRRVRQPGVRFEDLPAIATVLLSHNHYDHCDVPTLRRIATRWHPQVITPLGNARVLRSAGLRRVEERDWWQAAAADSLSITVTPARHFSARTPFDRNRALWGGFVIGVGARKIYFAGDSAYDACFRQIGERFAPIDLALIPIGAYEPRWFMKYVHMNPEEAVQAHVDLQAVRSIGMHFGTFQLTAEAIDDPVRGLAEACQRRNLAAGAFSTLAHGASHIIVPQS